MKLSLEEIAKLIGASVHGEPSKEILGINTLTNANSEQVSYAASRKYKKSLINSNAGAVIVDKNLIELCPTNALLVENVYLAYSILTQKFKNHQNINHFQKAENIIKSYSKVTIAPGCIIGKNVAIGENSSIGANCVIEDNVNIGKNSTIESNVTIQKGSQIGKNCVVSPGAIIGSEGFGNARERTKSGMPLLILEMWLLVIMSL